VSRETDSGSRGASAGKERKVPADDHYTIGRLVGVLQEEFPDLSISKIRYLEDRHLIQPERTEGGYRRYGGADLRRLRTILRLQRDEYLPLEVIKARLERGTAATTSRPLGPAQDSREPGILRQPAESLSWHEVKEATGADDGFLAQLADYKLIEASPRTLGGGLRETDVEVIRICQILARFGVEPRNLRLLKSSAEREAALLEQAVTTALRSHHEERRAEGERNLQELAVLVSRLVELLLYKELRRLVE